MFSSSSHALPSETVSFGAFNLKILSFDAGASSLPFVLSLILESAIMLTIAMIAFVEHWLAALILILFAYLVKYRYNHGLQRYPGPLLASLTDWWRFFDVLGRRPEVTHIKLHKKHGDIVRLGPNVLSFANPAALGTICGLNEGFVKVGDMSRVYMGVWY